MAEEKDCNNESIDLSTPMSETPIRAMVCLKRKEDIKRFEETEECFILDFDDPSDSLSKLSLEKENDNNHNDDSPDISVVAEKGQVACRDYPHARHLCVKFPFTTTPHESSCEMCFCYVCDSVAPCKYWTRSEKPHCDCDADSGWKNERDIFKFLAEEEE